MVSSLHEVMHRIFEEDPGIFARAFARIGHPFPEPIAAHPLPTDVTEIKPLERRVDTLLQLDVADGTSYVLAVEAQGKKDPAKHGSWAYYASFLQEKYRKPALLLVVCQDEATALWAEGPFHFGVPQWQTLTLRPLVLGPHNLPLITDPAEAAKDIPLATFSAIAHSKNRHAEEMLRALFTAFRAADDTVTPFIDFTEIGLASTQAASIWETLMAMDTSLFKGPSAQRLRRQGAAERSVECVLRVLDIRGIEVTDAQRERITACTDLGTFDRWLTRAVTVGRGDELFAED